MAKKKNYDDDDGRTIVDMSDVDPMPMLLPRFRRKEKAQSEMSKEDRRAVLLGSIGAVLLIGAVFVAAAAIVIWVMTLVWH